MKKKESCYVVSFAIIMLNTSLHNPSVKDKQTCEQFIKMCKETCKTLTDAQDNMLKVAEFELFSIKYILFMHLKKIGML